MFLFKIKKYIRELENDFQVLRRAVLDLRQSLDATKRKVVKLETPCLFDVGKVYKYNGYKVILIDTTFTYRYTRGEHEANHLLEFLDQTGKSVFLNQACDAGKITLSEDQTFNPTH